MVDHDADPSTAEETVHEDYPLDVRVVEFVPDGAEHPQYRFEAPEHTDISFADPEKATLYADVYFDTNGFQEEGTGHRGVPPEVVQAGRDTMAAYFLTMAGTDTNWVASFYGKKPTEIERYVGAVRRRAEEIRAEAAERGVEPAADPA
ncbi:hypothetical protein C475_01946 [Halosimplex carlsbadense 2-9-1]|uniref:Uncharacterized protein n=1 Tax=Halosimplex carlsbadense 2-9-1 TaxID=797114 RepID=M0D4Q7_9EURY|nr:hypothetical protein [Halosimplex carlsbadense]ELZ29672.1 hypothetical protein C475_01946 [Halosimplex carlsbadense 2-9-1]